MPAINPFNAIVFAVFDLGFVARCSLEEEDAADFRLAKIERIIEQASLVCGSTKGKEVLTPCVHRPRITRPICFTVLLPCRFCIP